MTHFLGKFFPRSRAMDPTTSHQAADSIKETAPMHMEVIHNALHEHGPLGKDGIARVTGLNQNQISRRLPEMQRMGLVKETGFTVPSDAGRQEREWDAL